MTMLRAAQLLSFAVCVATPAVAQGGEVRAPYTLDEYVEARRPIIETRDLTNAEKAQAKTLAGLQQD